MEKINKTVFIHCGQKIAVPTDDDFTSVYDHDSNQLNLIESCLYFLVVYG